MKQEEKELLLKDLCARLPYEVKVHIKGEYKTPRKVYTVYREDKTITYFKGLDCFEENIENVKPYLRPMSSMTEKEKKIYNNFFISKEIDNFDFDIPNYDTIDWLNAHHFDYRGLIEKGLALEAPEGMYNIEEK